MLTQQSSGADDPLVRFISQLQQTHDQTYRVQQTPDWWYFIPKNQISTQMQGWKLHLPALAHTALPLLELVAPLLLERSVYWKVLFSIEHLIRYSSPPASLPQLGKFITIYPKTDEIAVELASLLHQNVHGFPAPVIPSDFRYADESLVYYRYGGFKAQFFYHPQTALRTYCIITPDFKKIPDERTTIPHFPDWAHNPFPTSTQTKRSSKSLFGRGLKVRGIFSQSIKGGVYVVSDGKETFILKEARFGTCPDLQGRTMLERLSNEFQILQHLAPYSLAPKPHDIFDADNNRYLLMEHLPGQTLGKYIETQNYQPGIDDLEIRRFLCHSLISLVQKCHEHGIILRDLTPNNVLVTSSGCRLIDMELASFSESRETPFRGFTYGYIPLNEELSARQAFSYDLYALGAVLCFILTGIKPYLSQTENILQRLNELFDPDIFLRDPSFQDLAGQARTLLTTRMLSSEDQHPFPPSDSPAIDKADLLQNAIAIADHLYTQADFANQEQLWSFISSRGELFHPTSFYGGATGIAYYLCEIAQVTQNSKYYHHAARILDWLDQHMTLTDEIPLGLYFGYAGYVWTCAQIGHVLGDKHYQERALTLARQIAQFPVNRLDLTHGAAGRGLMHLQLYWLTGESEQLHYAQSLADELIKRAQRTEQGGLAWEEDEHIIWGFAHGAAGIAYFLLALYSETLDPRLRETLNGVNHTLLQVAIPINQGKGRTWGKDSKDTGTPWSHWCHGASGVGTYLIEAASILQDSPLQIAAIQAAQAIQANSGIATFCQCHGLAGDGDYLLHTSRAFSLPELEAATTRTIKKILTFRRTVNDVPAFVWSNEAMDPDPDYMTGYCGIYGFFLRYLFPDLPRPLSFQARRKER